MLNLITSHQKIVPEEICISIVEHDVTTSNIPFLSLLSQEYMNSYFLKIIFIYVRPIQVQIKTFQLFCIFIVAYNIGCLRRALDVFLDGRG